MAKEPDWQDVGSVEALSGREVQPIAIGRTRYALTYKGGQFGAIAATCNHVGGPLGEGHLEGEYVVCPWLGDAGHPQPYYYASPNPPSSSLEIAPAGWEWNTQGWTGLRRDAFAGEGVTFDAAFAACRKSLG